MGLLDDSRSAWRFAAAGALLALLVGLAYLPLRHNEFVNFDDDRLILDNPILRDLSLESSGPIFERQLFTPHYKPLVYLSWAVELRLYGPDPRVFHRHNLLLHLLNTLLVLGLVARLCPQEMTSGTRIAWATAVAALWALHPMKVESVAWAAERKDVLFAAFYLGAISSYLSWVDGRRWRWLALSVLLAIGGVLSKSMAITLPAALVVIDAVRARRWRLGLLADKLPHLIVAATAVGLYGLRWGAGGIGYGVGLAGSDAVAPWDRLFAAVYRHPAFAAHWLVPTDLAVIYPIPAWFVRAHWPHFAALVAAHLALLACLPALWRRSRRAVAALLFYTLTLLPVLLAPVSTTNFLSDRYTYLPSLGLSALLVMGAAAATRRLPRCHLALAAAGVMLLTLLAGLTWRQVGVWRDSETLWDRNLAVRPPHAFAHNNRGAARLARGDQEGALADFERAVALRPEYAEARANRAEMRRRTGLLNQALSDIRIAAARQPMNAAFHRIEGSVLADLERLEEAVTSYTLALEQDPSDLEARYLRAQAHRRNGDLGAARADIDAVLHARPATADHLLLRALIRARQGDLRGALVDTTRVLELDPANAVALNNRAFLRLRLDQPALALADLDRALALRPGYGLALRSRGDALAALDRRAEACAAWRRAARAGTPATAERLAACPTSPTPAPAPTP